MKTYTIDTFRITRKGREFLERVERLSPFFSSRDYKLAVESLGFWAAQGIENKDMVSEIRRDGALIGVLRGETRVDGARIWENVYFARPREKYGFVRCLTIAD